MNEQASSVLPDRGVSARSPARLPSRTSVCTEYTAANGDSQASAQQVPGPEIQLLPEKEERARLDEIPRLHPVEVHTA